MESNTYNILKYLHIVFFTTWMAGLFYLPRLFVYHSKAKDSSTEYTTFLIMEKKLLRYIMNPSMILTWILGTSLVVNIQAYDQIWLNIKFVLIVIMSVFHMYCAKVRKGFENRINKNSENFYRAINEIPTVLFLIIVYLVVFKPMV
ncbi:MAG: protoporphyrinogen oxidase HemJ [Alphaproteobacteria bacterium]